MADNPHAEFFRNLCVHAGVALIAADRDLRIRFWNPAAGRIFGGSVETMLGQPIVSVVPHESRETATRLVERVLHHGEVSEFEFPHRSPTGSPIWLAVTISPIFQDGSTVGVSVFVRDVTRRMNLERQTADARKMTALGSMAGEVAHHFNNIIGGIITSIDFVQDSDDVMTLRRVLKTTAAALTRANELTLDLLAFAEGDRTECPAESVREIVTRFASILEPSLARQGIRLETDLQPVQAWLPTRRVNTILKHLTTNAREAMPDGGTLRIELGTAPDSRILLRVSDTGVGIPPEHAARAFEPFFTTKQSDPDRGPHSGLGLAVVHGIVRDLKGTVSLASREGGGTVCSVSLPPD